MFQLHPTPYTVRNSKWPAFSWTATLSTLSRPLLAEGKQHQNIMPSNGVLPRQQLLTIASMPAPSGVHAIVEIHVLAELSCLRIEIAPISWIQNASISQCLTIASVPALSLRKSRTQSLKSMCLRSRTVSALNHQFRVSEPHQDPSVPGRVQQCERAQTHCGGASLPAAAIWPISMNSSVIASFTIADIVSSATSLSTTRTRLTSCPSLTRRKLNRKATGAV